MLGDIKRLGNFEEKYHREIGSKVAERQIDTLITIGKRAEAIADQAKKMELKQRFIRLKM